MQNEMTIKTAKQEIITLITAIIGMGFVYMVFSNNFWLLMMGVVCGGLTGKIICIVLGYVTHKQVVSETTQSVRTLVLTIVMLLFALGGTWLWWYFFGSQ